jgi:hypothetical protein
MTYPKGDQAMPNKSSNTYESLTNGRGETVLWQREIKEGLFRRRVVGMERITTSAVYDSTGEHVIHLHELDDVIIMNSHSHSQGQFMISSSGGCHMGSRTGFGMGQ